MRVLGVKPQCLPCSPREKFFLTVFYFVAMMSLTTLRVIIRKIPTRPFIVTTVMMLAGMLFTNLLNFLLISR